MSADMRAITRGASRRGEVPTTPDTQVKLHQYSCTRSYMYQLGWLHACLGASNGAQEDLPEGRFSIVFQRSSETKAEVPWHSCVSLNRFELLPREPSIDTIL